MFISYELDLIALKDVKMFLVVLLLFSTQVCVFENSVSSESTWVSFNSKFYLVQEQFVVSTVPVDEKQSNYRLLSISFMDTIATWNKLPRLPSETQTDTVESWL